jgi:hypothetical protein
LQEKKFPSSTRRIVSLTPSGFENVVVPEAKDAPAELLEPSGAACVTIIVVVLPAVGFDDETVFDAGKVGDEGAKRALTAEFVAAQATAAEERPEAALGVGHLTAEGAGSQVRHRRCQCITLPLLRNGSLPLPLSRERG